MPQSLHLPRQSYFPYPSQMSFEQRKETTFDRRVAYITAPVVRGLCCPSCVRFGTSKCVRFGTSRSRVRISAGSYQDLVHWYCSLLTRRTVCRRATGNTIGLERGGLRYFIAIHRKMKGWHFYGRPRATLSLTTPLLHSLMNCIDDHSRVDRGVTVGSCRFSRWHFVDDSVLLAFSEQS